MKTTEYTIKNSNDISFGKSVRVLGKVAGGTAARGLGLVSGTSKALAMQCLSADEGSYVDKSLKYNNKSLFRGAEMSAYGYVSSVLATEDTSKKEDKSADDL